MPLVLFVLLVLFLLGLVVFGPIFTIWSLNLLFGLSIPVTFKTWLSAAWISVIVGGTAKYASHK